MIEGRPQRILLPVKVSFMALTMLLGLLFNLLPWRDITGLPDMLALVIAFWCIHQPRRMGIGAAWMLGLVMDAANSALLGQHALAYSVLAFAAVQLNRRVLWFGIWPQALHVLLLLLGSQLLMLCVRLAAGGAFPGFTWFAGSGIAALLWPVVTFVLLAPQRQPETVDVDRPI
jgi:rod shape-determining protein MreD